CTPTARRLSLEPARPMALGWASVPCLALVSPHSKVWSGCRSCVGTESRRASRSASRHKRQLRAIAITRSTKIHRSHGGELRLIAPEDLTEERAAETLARELSRPASVAATCARPACCSGVRPRPARALARRRSWPLLAGATRARQRQGPLCQDPAHDSARVQTPCRWCATERRCSRGGAPVRRADGPRRTGGGELRPVYGLAV
ncbi:MAG: hypothetical protein QOF86_1447, partial [Baekduia sp.]|nr:hypothetical protein [Baekduia sp.]